jgi:DNA-binding MarR family transcriptional regulator
MSKEHTEALETSGQSREEIGAKKARKAELKAVEKARKAVRKALRKIEKQKRKEADAAKDAMVSADGQDKSHHLKAAKKSKPVKNEQAEGFVATLNLGAKLQAVSRSARGNLASQLLEHGLYAGQEQVLFLLDEHGPLSLAELAEKLDVRAPTITKTVTRMEAQAFLSRAVSRDDARSIIIALTPEGRNALKICRRIVADIEAKTFSVLSASECENLGKMLDLVFSQVKESK